MSKSLWIGIFVVIVSVIQAVAFFLPAVAVGLTVTASSGMVGAGIAVAIALTIASYPAQKMILEKLQALLTKISTK